MQQKIVLIIAVGVIVASIFLGPNFKERLQPKVATEGLLGNVKDGEYENAFYYIASYDPEKDKEKFEEAKKDWVAKVEDLIKSKKIKLDAYDNVEVWWEDGNPVGVAQVEMIENGKKVTEIIELSFEKTDKWYVKDIVNTDKKTTTAWEDILESNKK